MTDTTKLEAAFDAWLKARRDDLTTRQQFWLAWKAGAEWAIAEIKEGVGLPPNG
jgi:hypothetical protein